MSATMSGFGPYLYRSNDPEQLRAELATLTAERNAARAEVSRLRKTIDEAVWNDPTTKDDLRAELAAKDAEIERLRDAFIELIHRVNVWGSKTAGQSLPVELSDAIFQADLAVTQKQEGGAQ